MSGYESRPHSDAFLTAVKAVWPRVGDAQAPADVTLPYCIVYPLGSATFDGSNAPTDLDADAFPLYQVTSVGGTREQAEFMRDKVRTGLLGATLTVSGRQVGPVRLEDEQSVQLDPQVTPHLLYAVDRMRVYSTPA